MTTSDNDQAKADKAAADAKAKADADAKAADASDTVKVELIAGKPEDMPRDRAERLAAEGHAAAQAALS